LDLQALSSIPYQGNRRVINSSLKRLCHLRFRTISTKSSWAVNKWDNTSSSKELLRNFTISGLRKWREWEKWVKTKPIKLRDSTMKIWHSSLKSMKDGNLEIKTLITAQIKFIGQANSLDLTRAKIEASWEPHLQYRKTHLAWTSLSRR
jgi:hypothetical protein